MGTSGISGIPESLEQPNVRMNFLNAGPPVTQMSQMNLGCGVTSTVSQAGQNLCAFPPGNFGGANAPGMSRYGFAHQATQMDQRLDQALPLGARGPMVYSAFERSLPQ